MATTKKRKCFICKKAFTPEYDTPSGPQLVCSHKCCLLYYGKLKCRRTRKLARSVAGMVGRRSIGEVQFEYDNLIEHKTNKKKIKSINYESDKFVYSVEETRSYTPDWTLVTKSGKTIYIEYKGVLDLDTRKKMVRVRDQHSTRDIRFVFQRGANKIRGGSKTTYMMWAAKKGFKAADGHIPTEWLK